MIDILIYIFSILFLIIGYIGCLLPVVPGPMIAFLGIWILYFSSGNPFSIKFLVIWFLVHIFAIVLDNFIPSLGTKIFKGTKRGIRGSNIGILFAIIILPILGITLGPFGLFGVIFMPFLGAYIGEFLNTKKQKKALKSALGSFFGFLSGTFIKILLTTVMGYYIVQTIFF